MSEHCVCCGEIIPEGRHVCPQCEKGGWPTVKKHEQTYKIKHKWNRNKQMERVKSCPLCGDTHIMLTRTVAPKLLKKWGLECRYCHCSYSHYLTIRGAIRAWNKATNVSQVREVEGVKIG